MPFSATLPPGLARLASAHVREPLRIEVGQLAAPPSQTTQDVYLVDGPDKTPLLLSLIAKQRGTVLALLASAHRRGDRRARPPR